MYPEANEMVAYGEFREPFQGIKDNRFVVCVNVLVDAVKSSSRSFMAFATL